MVVPWERKSWIFSPSWWLQPGLKTGINVKIKDHFCSSETIKLQRSSWLINEQRKKLDEIGKHVCWGRYLRPHTEGPASSEWVETRLDEGLRRLGLHTGSKEPPSKGEVKTLTASPRRAKPSSSQDEEARNNAGDAQSKPKTRVSAKAWSAGAN